MIDIAKAEAFMAAFAAVVEHPRTAYLLGLAAPDAGERQEIARISELTAHLKALLLGIDMVLAQDDSDVDMLRRVMDTPEGAA